MIDLQMENGMDVVFSLDEIIPRLEALGTEAALRAASVLRDGVSQR